MSRGIGELQRAILDTLQEAKEKVTYYRGSQAIYFADQPGWVYAGGATFRLASDVYDLRASMVYLARKRGMTDRCGYVKGAFSASFSRAVRGLTACGLLTRLVTVPIAEYAQDDWGRVLFLADGAYYRAGTRQTRFVTLPDKR